MSLPPSSPSPVPPTSSRRPLLTLVWTLGCLSVVLLAALAYVAYGKSRPSSAVPVAVASPSTTLAPTSSATATPPPTVAPTVSAPGLPLDASKAYGDRYADGILPVGDGKYVTSGPKQGYVYACSTYAHNLTSGQGGGAQARGPWFTNGNASYDVSKKLHVQGSVSWHASLSANLANGKRTIVTNDLPSHPTGTFPIASTDPAYSFDRNPNRISSQQLTYSLPADPAYSDTPSCMSGEVGVMLTGVALFNGFDAGARDAGAWEIQDECSGHPEKDGEYHYHTLSSCITDTSVQTVIGYALDGFPITGPKVGTGNILTTADLDECHGITSRVVLDGKTVTTYHYVMTQDFPYSASCFRGTPTNPPHPS